MKSSAKYIDALECVLSLVYIRYRQRSGQDAELDSLVDSIPDLLDSVVPEKISERHFDAPTIEAVNELIRNEQDNRRMRRLQHNEQ